MYLGIDRLNNLEQASANNSIVHLLTGFIAAFSFETASASHWGPCEQIRTCTY